MMKVGGDAVGDAVARGPTLSVCMIVRDELKLLPGTLDNLRALAPEEIVVVDTGSVDGSQNVAREHGARVIDFSWCDDYAAARNVSFAQATGDWLMWWDADFRLAASGPATIRSFMSSTVFDAASFVHHEGRDDEGALERILSGERATSASHAGAMQLLRRRAEPIWTGRVHEGLHPWAAARAAARGLQRIDTMLPVDVVHVGWSRLRLPDKVARYRRLLNQRLREDAHDVTAHQFLVMDALEGNEPAEAERWLNAARTLPGHLHGQSAFFALAVYGAAVYLSADRPQQAIDCLKWGLCAFGVHETLSYLLGVARQRTKSPLALRSYYEAIAAAGRSRAWDLERYYWAIPGAGSWRAWLSLAGCHMNRGEFRLAEIAAVRALSDGGHDCPELDSIRSVRAAAEKLAGRGERVSQTLLEGGPTLAICVLPGRKGSCASSEEPAGLQALAELRALDPNEIVLLDDSPAGAGWAEALRQALARISADWVLVWDRDDRLAPGNAAIVRAFLAITSADVGIVRRHHASAVEADAADVVAGAKRLGCPEDAPLLGRRARVMPGASGSFASLQYWHWEGRDGHGRSLREAELAVDVVSYAQARQPVEAAAPARCRPDDEVSAASGRAWARQALQAFSAGDFVAAGRDAEEARRRLPPASLCAADHFALAVVAAEAFIALGEPSRALEALDRGEQAHGEHRVLAFVRGRALEQSGRLVEALASFHRAIVLGHGHDVPRRFWWLSTNEEIAGWLGWSKIASCYEKLGETALAFSAVSKALQAGGSQGPQASALQLVHQRLAERGAVGSRRARVAEPAAGG